MSEAALQLTKPEIFQYRDFRLYLSDTLDYYMVNTKVSLRGLAQRCNINSPNYLQRVRRGERNPSAAMAQKIAVGLRLDDIEKEYFLNLVALANVDTGAEQSAILEELYRLERASEGIEVEDENIYSSWLHGVIYEMASLPGFRLTEDNVQQRLRQYVPVETIRKSISFLLDRKYVLIDSHGRCSQANVVFKRLSPERRVLDVQKNHIQFLDMAKHRVVDNIEDRCFQGLTIAVAEEDFGELQKKLQDCIDDIRKTFATDQSTDQVVRVQLASFFLTK